MAEEIDDIDEIEKDDAYEEAMARERHLEMKGLLKGILTELQKDKKDNSVSEVIAKLVDKMEGLKPQEFPELPTPQVTVVANQDKVVTSVEQLGRDLLVELKKYNERPIVDRFEIIKDKWENTKEVKVIYKK